MNEEVKHNLQIFATILASIWIVFYGMQIVSPELSQRFGVLPRDFERLFGIFSMHFIHGDFQHLLSNTKMLVVIMIILCITRLNLYKTVLQLMLISGSLLWLFGTVHYHIGASMMIYALTMYLIVSSFLDKRLIPFIIGIVVSTLYISRLFENMVPHFDSIVSWDSHVIGFISGTVLALFHYDKNYYRY